MPLSGLEITGFTRKMGLKLMERTWISVRTPPLRKQACERIQNFVVVCFFNNNVFLVATVRMFYAATNSASSGLAGILAGEPGASERSA